MNCTIAHHSNPHFINSVLVGLCEGFWPLAEVPENYPLTYDNPSSLKTERQCKFIRAQISKEVAVRRFSESFGPDLLPGMYSPPIHAVPHTQDNKL